MNKTDIEWCDSTVNPIVGCTPISKGCKECYAAKMASRGFKCKTWQGTAREGKWTGKVGFNIDVLRKLVKTVKPKRIFMVSMGDIFYERVTHLQRLLIFAAMAHCPQHTFYILTKRPEEMKKFFAQQCMPGILQDAWIAVNMPGQWNALNAPTWPLPNVWAGVSVENQDVMHRVATLCETNAAHRFVSVEPMLGPVDLCAVNYPRAEDQDVKLLDSLRGMTCDDMPTHPALDWVICGAETGTGARHMQEQWAWKLSRQCVDAGVPFFFKKNSDGGRELSGIRYEGIPG